MKAFKELWILLLLLATFTKGLQAETNLQITYKYEYLKAFAVTLQNLDNQRHTIHLEDVNGRTLIQEKITGQAQFGRMYNLEELPEGKYTIIVENEQQIIRQSIVINRRFLTVSTIEKERILKPAIKIDADLIAINMLHFKKSAILITIEKAEGQTVYHHFFRPFGSLNKQLNIGKLKEGQYTLIIQTATYLVKQQFTKSNNPVLIAGNF